jgi:hypothetical protein
MEGWSTFFAAELGAAAALTGLLFVAVSINLTRILEFPHLPARAAEALLNLVSVLFITSFALIPGQPAIAWALEIGGTGLIVWVVNTVLLIRLRTFDRQYSGFTIRFLMNQLPPLPFIVSGALILARQPAGFYWIVPGILLSFGAGIFGAWVLLVEIQR